MDRGQARGGNSGASWRWDGLCGRQRCKYLIRSIIHLSLSFRLTWNTQLQKNLHALGDPGSSTGRRNIPSQIEVPATSNPIVTVSGLHSSGSEGPEELEKLRALCEMAKEHLWMLDCLANPGAVSVRHQGQDGAEDTPGASLSLICNELPLQPPAAPHAGLDLTTPERQIEHPALPSEHPTALIKESRTKPPAPVTHPAHRSQHSSSPLAPNNTLSTSQVRRSTRRSTGSKYYEIHYFFE